MDDQQSTHGEELGNVVAPPVYICENHGEVTDVMIYSFMEELIMGPGKVKRERLEKVFCTACISADLEYRLGTCTPKGAAHEP